MKRGLLTTTGLIAVGLLALPMPARAQPKPASVTVGGYLDDLVGYLSQGQAMGAGSSAARPSDSAGEPDAHPVGRAGFDHGMTIGFRPELAATAGDDPGDASVMFIEGRFGRIELGSSNERGGRAPFRAPDALARGWLADGRFQNWAASPAASAFNRSAIGGGGLGSTDSDGGRIGYYTPRLEGVEFGFTYVPDMTPNNANVIARGTARLATGPAIGPQPGFTAGANFVRDFGGLNVAASLGYVQWQAADNADAPNPEAFGAGLAFGYGGFKLGGSWARISGGRAESAGLAATPGFANAARLDGRSFEIGASYSIGAAAFSLTYFDDRSHESSAVGLDRGDDKLTGIALSGKYRLGSGFNLDAVLFHSRYRGASSDTPRNESKATGFVTGLVLQF